MIGTTTSGSLTKTRAPREQIYPLISTRTHTPKMQTPTCQGDNTHTDTRRYSGTVRKLSFTHLTITRYTQQRHAWRHMYTDAHTRARTNTGDCATTPLPTQAPGWDAGRGSETLKKENPVAQVTQEVSLLPTTQSSHEAWQPENHHTVTSQ